MYSQCCLWIEFSRSRTMQQSRQIIHLGGVRNKSKKGRKERRLTGQLSEQHPKFHGKLLRNGAKLQNYLLRKGQG